MTVGLALVLTALQAYLLGSIDTGILVSKYRYHDDVRTHGSGAAGMTNMLRTFGKKAAAITAVGDVLKGVLAVCIGRWIFGSLAAGAAPASFGAYIAAVFAVIGHARPVYFKLKGGKGVLVAGGAILATEPVLIPLLAVVFLVCLLLTGMVSLGSIMMAAIYPFLTLACCLVRGCSAGETAVCTACAAIIGLGIIYLHRTNIMRIKAGKEYRFKVGRYKNKDTDKN